MDERGEELTRLIEVQQEHLKELVRLKLDQAQTVRTRVGEILGRMRVEESGPGIYLAAGAEQIREALALVTYNFPTATEWRAEVMGAGDGASAMLAQAYLEGERRTLRQDHAQIERVARTRSEAKAAVDRLQRLWHSLSASTDAQLAAASYTIAAWQQEGYDGRDLGVWLENDVQVGVERAQLTHLRGLLEEHLSLNSEIVA